jgi:hypothetical protein
VGTDKELLPRLGAGVSSGLPADGLEPGAVGESPLQRMVESLVEPGGRRRRCHGGYVFGRYSQWMAMAGIRKRATFRIFQIPIMSAMYMWL